MIFQKKILEKITTKVTLAIMLKEKGPPERAVTEAVFLKVSGTGKSVIRHSTGYFLLMDLPEGEHKITAGGKCYDQEDFSVTINSIDPEKPFKDKWKILSIEHILTLNEAGRLKLKS